MSMPKLQNTPISSGVYFFRDKNRRVLYIGKAANLKNRIKSYFSGQKDPRISKMLEGAADVDWQETDSEIEALILESQLIKKYRPPFNIMLRDDKQYFYVGFTNEQFPKILISHQPSKKFTVYSDQLTENKKLPVNQLKTEHWSLPTNFIGPFTDGTALKATLKLLRRIFPYCTCKQKHNNYCLNYHIGNCPGFCCLNPVRDRPAKSVATATSGRPVSNGVKKEAMARQVVVYKKNIAAIKEILSGKKKSLIKRFEKKMNALAQKGGFEKAIELRDRIEKLKMVFKNAQILKEIGRKEIDGFNILAELKEVLHLSAPPRRIEGYDVSNIQGEFATGAMVVFTDGQPDKNKYRKFRIKIAGEPNDIAMLKEVLTRRFRHPEWPYPDLILIDGGKGQLNAAAAVISKQIQMMKILPIRPKRIEDPRSAQPIGTIIALTKNIKHKGHHVYASTKKLVMPLRNLPPAARNLILQIDAEAHRFAINYYRKLHSFQSTPAVFVK